MDESTTLADLLELNLHECEEEVKNIVDKAVKEMSMEKYMRELNATWSKMEFEKEIHARTGATLIRASEELIETLEENQVPNPLVHGYCENCREFIFYERNFDSSISGDTTKIFQFFKHLINLPLLKFKLAINIGDCAKINGIIQNIGVYYKLLMTIQDAIVLP